MGPTSFLSIYMFICTDYLFCCVCVCVCLVYKISHVCCELVELGSPSTIWSLMPDYEFISNVSSDRDLYSRSVLSLSSIFIDIFLLMLMLIYSILIIHEYIF